MTIEDKELWLKRALMLFGVIFLFVYPMGLIWPAGWVWHGGQGAYYLQMISGVYIVMGLFMIRAAKAPAEHASFISFVIWSSVAHAGIMGVQAITDAHEYGHLIGDVPALFLVAAVLGYLSAGVTNTRAVAAT